MSNMPISTHLTRPGKTRSLDSHYVLAHAGGVTSLIAAFLRLGRNFHGSPGPRVRALMILD